MWFHARADEVLIGGNDHGNKVTSVLIAQNNYLPSSVQKPTLSGVITSVPNLEYFVAFYSIGKTTGGAPVGGQTPVENEPISDEELTHALADIASSINALEEIIHYSGQFDIVNLSIAGKCASLCDKETFERWKELIKEMPDVAVIVAAGNYSENAANFVPARFSIELPNVITVGSVGWDNRWSKFSNYGEAVTIGAPGNDVLVVSTLPKNDEDHCRHSSDLLGLVSKTVDYTGYKRCKGTSFSTPMVAGTVALMKALNPEMDPRTIKDTLTLTGDRSSLMCRSGPSGVCPEAPDQLAPARRRSYGTFSGSTGSPNWESDPPASAVG